MKTHNKMLHADMLGVIAGSCLIVAYLVITWITDPEAHSDEGIKISQSEPNLHTTQLTDDKSIPASEWIIRHHPVPDYALYPYSADPDKSAPIPTHEPKTRSWHNRLLFPTVRCPYCGRRVPTRKGSYMWLIIGFIGQIGFTARFLVQWLATEKARASVIPTSFWYLSIFGSVLLLAYAISIIAWPIILGQLPNVFIYGRNLYFIKHKTKHKDNTA